MTSNSKAEGRFGKQDFRYVAEEDAYICPAGERLTYHYTNEENGLVLRRYWTNACQSCAIKHSCTTAKERRITRWEHEHILKAVQRRLDEHPEKHFEQLRATGRVVLTTDTIRTRGDGYFTRTGYVAVYDIADLKFENGYGFRFVKRYKRAR
jgi:hypothetical protein